MDAAMFVLSNLKGTQELIAQDAWRPEEPFMPPGLLDSQFKTWSRRTRVKIPVTVSIDAPVDHDRR